MTTIYSVGVDKNKELAVYLMGQAQKYVSKTETPSHHIKKLTKQLPSEIDVHTLKHIRIITGENVRLRNTPSMHGDVLVTLENTHLLSLSIKVIESGYIYNYHLENKRSMVGSIVPIPKQ